MDEDDHDSHRKDEQQIEQEIKTEQDISRETKIGEDEEEETVPLVLQALDFLVTRLVTNRKKKKRKQVLELEETFTEMGEEMESKLPPYIQSKQKFGTTFYYTIQKADKKAITIGPQFVSQHVGALKKHMAYICHEELAKGGGSKDKYRSYGSYPSLDDFLRVYEGTSSRERGFLQVVQPQWTVYAHFDIESEKFKGVPYMSAEWFARSVKWYQILYRFLDHVERIVPVVLVGAKKRAFIKKLGQLGKTEWRLSYRHRTDKHSNHIHHNHMPFEDDIVFAMICMFVLPNDPILQQDDEMWRVKDGARILIIDNSILTTRRQLMIPGSRKATHEPNDPFFRLHSSDFRATFDLQSEMDRDPESMFQQDREVIKKYFVRMNPPADGSDEEDLPMITLDDVWRYMVSVSPTGADGDQEELTKLQEKFVDAPIRPAPFYKYIQSHMVLQRSGKVGSSKDQPRRDELPSERMSHDRYYKLARALPTMSKNRANKGQKTMVDLLQLLYSNGIGQMDHMPN